MSRAFPQSAVVPLSAQSQTEGTDGPEPGWWEAAGASFRLMEDTQDLMEQVPRKDQQYDNQLEALKALGVDTSKEGPLYREHRSTVANSMFGPGLAMAGSRRVVDRSAVFAKMKEFNGRNPAHFKDLPATQDEYDQQIATRFGARERDQRTASRGGITASLAGGMGSAVTEPINQISMLFGAGQANLVRLMAINSLIGGATEVALLPDAKRAYDRMGETFGAQQMAEQVGMGLAGGAAVPVLFRVAGAGLRVTGKPLQPAAEAAWARILPMIPEKMRPKMTGLDDLPDGILADVMERSFGRDNMSPDQKAMIEVLRRSDDFQSSNPYMPDAAGLEAHQRRLEAAFDRIAANAPVSRVTRSQGPVRPPFEMPKAQRAGAMRTDVGRAVQSEGFNPIELKARIRGPESGGNDKAVNRMGSSASGRYQFIESTFKSFYQRAYAATPAQANAAWANNRFDANVQERLMDSLINHNAAVLRRQGLPVNTGSMYAMHVLGEGNGPKLMRAAPDTPTSQLLSAQIIQQNASYFKGKTAGQALAIIASKVGGAVPSNAEGRVASFSTRTGQAIDDVTADLAVQQQSAAAAAGLRAADDALAAPRAPLIGDDVMQSANDTPSVMSPPLKPVSTPERVPLSVDQMLVIPAMRDLINNDSISLNRIDGLAKRLNADQGDVVLVLQDLAKKGAIRTTKKGTYARIPRETGPVDVLAYIARNGGIRDDEGHALGLKGISKQQRREMVPAAIKDGLRRRSSSRRDWQQFLPGAGPLLRYEGRSIDEVGLLLQERGYMGTPDGARPSVDEVLEFLETRIQSGEKRFIPGEEPDVEYTASGFQSDEHQDFVERQLDALLNETGQEFDDGARSAILNRYLKRGDDDIDAAVVDVINDEIDSVRLAAYAELGDDLGGEIEDQWIRALAQDGAFSGPVGRRYQADARDAGEVRSTGENVSQFDDALDEGIGSRGIDPDTLSMFDTPDAPGMMFEAKSLRHDLDTLLKDDAAFDPDFKMIDDAGNEVSLADLRASIDADEAMLKTIKDCL